MWYLCQDMVTWDFLTTKNGPSNSRLPGGFTALQNAGALLLQGFPDALHRRYARAQVRHRGVREATRGLKPRDPLGSCFTYEEVMMGQHVFPKKFCF